MNIPNTPTSPGFYWARRGNCHWYDLIVHVYGDSPFFRIEAWDRRGNGVIRDLPAWDISGWGPKIADEIPEVPKGELPPS